MIGTIFIDKRAGIWYTLNWRLALPKKKDSTDIPKSPRGRQSAKKDDIQLALEKMRKLAEKHQGNPKKNK